MAGFTAAVVLAAGLAACGGGDSAENDTSARAEPTAGRWRTWVLSSGSEIEVAPPPEEDSDRAEADRKELERAARKRTPAVLERIKRWSGPLPTAPWTETAFEFVKARAKDPPLSSRNYALLHVAMYDAVVSSWHWKYVYDQEAPDDVESVVPAGADPSYPSEHAAMAGAASRVLAHLYPEQPADRLDEMAEEAGRSRVEAGTNRPSDVEAGMKLGRAVADKVIARAKTDGSDRQWDGKRPPGIGRGPEFWEPPPGAVSPPTSPLAGTWRTWVMSSGSTLRPPPPPKYGSPEFVAAAREIIDIGKNLTPEQQQIARFYEGAEGTVLPAGIIVNVAQEDVLKAAKGDIEQARLTTPRVARALAMLNVALADAGVATWDAKFTYWNPRPENAIRDLGLDRSWKPMLPTPRFPAYPSGSAGYAGAAEVVLAHLLPRDAAKFRARAEEQAESRLYAGIHWRYDSVSLDMGREIGRLVVERVKRDGARS